MEGIEYLINDKFADGELSDGVRERLVHLCELSPALAEAFIVLAADIFREGFDVGQDEIADYQRGYLIRRDQCQ